MTAQTEFLLVFEHLKNILKPYAGQLTLNEVTSDTYYLDGPYSERWKKELFFGSAQIKKNYVSFYLMPVYMYPSYCRIFHPVSRSTGRESPALISRKWNLTCLQNWLN